MNVRQSLPARFTNAEFQRLVRSGGFGDTRVELRRGMILKMNPTHVPHARTKRHLGEAIKAALHAAMLDWIVDTEVSVDFGDGFEPSPDIVVWDPAAAAPDLDGPVPANAVRFVVEVSDTTLAGDLGEKLDDYAAAGLAEYWVADVKGRRILRHSSPSDATYARREPAQFGDTFAALVYPALVIDTSALVSPNP